MTPSDQELRAAFAGAPREAAGPDCPPPERLWSAARGELAPDDAAAIVGHTTTCAACAEDWRLAVELGARPPSRSRLRPLVWVGAVAAAAAVALVVGLLPRRTAEDPPIYREPSAAAITSAIPDEGVVPRAAPVLRWSAGPPGSRYRVEVATEDLAVIARGHLLDKPELTLPAAAVAGLPAGARLLWRVEMVLPDGVRVSSPTFRVRLE